MPDERMTPAERFALAAVGSAAVATISLPFLIDSGPTRPGVVLAVVAFTVGALIFAAAVLLRLFLRNNKE